MSGEVKGFKLKTRGHDVRPTLARVKKSLFSILGERIVDASFLDLFSGTGNIGIEALSRGARQAFFVERGIIQIKTIMGNIHRAHLEDRACVVRMSAAFALKKFDKEGMQFDIIFFAPPFKKYLAKSTLELLDTHAIITEDAVIIAEHHQTEHIPDNFLHFSLWRQERYGDHGLSFFKAGIL
jgi:16S rRNA (guanine(966)-N(2))-methyltransferase RsmD